MEGARPGLQQRAGVSAVGLSVPPACGGEAGIGALSCLWFGVSGLPASAVTGEGALRRLLGRACRAGVLPLVLSLAVLGPRCWRGLLASCRVGLLPAVAALPCAAGLVAPGSGARACGVARGVFPDQG